jgi:xanthine dehydrogenase accessory factor
VEAAVAFEAMAALGTGNDRYLLLGEASRFFDIVLPCGGGITLVIHCLRDSAGIHEILKKLNKRGRAGLRYDPATQRLEAVDWVETIGWREDLFYSAYRPKPRLLLSGGSIERERTARLAGMAGFELSLREDVEKREDIALRIDSDSAVVLLHHNLDDELPVLTAALDANPFYIGALGSSKTHERRKAALKELGYADGQVARIKAPIGLFGKARDANSLALSVLADVAAARTMPQMAVN